MSYPVMTLQQMAAALATTPAAELAAVYGDKAVGCAELLARQPAMDADGYYHVPDPARSFGVPAAGVGEVSDDRLNLAFDRFMVGRGSPRLWPYLLRSSAVGEATLPGKFSSPPVLVYKDKLNVSRRKFMNGVRQVQEKVPNLAVLTMPMVGAWNMAKAIFGYNCVSFVAETVNPIRTSEMSVAIVYGLGHTVVDTLEEAIIMNFDRQTGEMTFIGDAPSNLVMERFGSSHYMSNSHYRQQHISYYDGTAMDVVRSAFVPPCLVQSLPEIMWSPHGLINENIYESLLNIYRERRQIMSFNQVINLVRALQYMYSQYGAVQMEGLFEDGESKFPFFTQKIKVPELVRSERELGNLRRDLYSKEVFGEGKYRGPLVLVKNAATAPMGLKLLDDLFGFDGYMLCHKDISRYVLNLTPNAKVRLGSDTMEDGSFNFMSHVITDLRFRAAEGRNSRYLVLGVRPDEELYEGSFIVGDNRAELVTIFKDSLFDSNGREAAVQLGTPMTEGEFRQILGKSNR